MARAPLFVPGGLVFADAGVASRPRLSPSRRVLGQTVALVTDIPDTRYARSGEVHVAYQVFGAGPIELVVVPGFTSHLEVIWEHPLMADFYRPSGVVRACRGVR